MIIISVVVYLLFFVKAENPGATSEETTTVISRPIAVFKTSYFQFQTSEGWEEVATNDNTYFYRLRKNSINLHDIQITVNPTQQQINRLSSSRAQVVDPEDGLLNPVDGLTDECETAGEGLVDGDEVTMNETTYTCTTGSALFDVAVSQRGGTPLLELRRANGETMRMLIYYRDLRSVPDGRELAEIVRTFQII